MNVLPYEAPQFDDVVFRPVLPQADVDVLHSWFTHPRCTYWGMGRSSRHDVIDEYTEIDDNPFHWAELGELAGQPVVLTERYHPRWRVLANQYDYHPGDIGMHVLVGPADTAIHGFTDAMMTAVMARCFADESVTRVVVEPDIGNDAIHAKNAAAGFEVLGEITLPTKTALLSACTREQFYTSRLGRVIDAAAKSKGQS